MSSSGESVTNGVTNGVSNGVSNGVNQPVTICPNGYYFRCNKFGCNCRRNMLDWFNNLSKGGRIAVGVVCGIIGLLLLLGLIYGGHYAINMYRRNNTYTTSSSVLFLKS